MDVGRSNRRWPTAYWLIGAILLLSLATPALGQSDDQQLSGLLARGQAEQWTFSVAPNPATEVPLEDLCGLVVPDDWQAGARFVEPATRLGLPTSFDWRALGGCTPVRNQLGCGSCWAFATVGPLECNILIRDGVSVNLSEQWLLSCNLSGYNCSGGWFAHEYHEYRTDSCGDTGAVLESEFPYVASRVACGCPYTHPYTIANWAYIGSSGGIPSTAAIKQAIMDYGPVSVGVCADSAFSYYDGGVFNASTSGTVNHAVVLVGWDDTQGASGVWFLRNSWGPNWGENGYMRIEYGCSSVGYAACFVEYNGTGSAEIEVTPTSSDFGDVAVGSTADRTFTVSNVGGQLLEGTVATPSAPFSITSASSYSLDPGESTTITVRFAPTVQGDFSATLQFSGGGDATATVIGTGIGPGPGDTCAGAPAINDGAFTASSVGATTDGSASCDATAGADVWWKYTAAYPGTATIDTCGSNFDTVLSVYSACGGTELACSDDATCGTTPGSASSVSFPITAGSQYLIRVAGAGGATGQIVLNVDSVATTLTISGRVITSDGTPVAGATLTGLPDAPVTGSDGYYTATVSYSFSGTARPQKIGYTFSPATISYSAITSDRLNQNYSATPPNFIISGHVTEDDGSGIAGVTIAGLPGNPTTNVHGQYSATVPLGFSGTATPSKTGCSFSPTSRTYTSVSADLALEDYDATVWTGSLQVSLTPFAARLDGARWRVDSGVWQDSGRIVSSLAVGQHTISYAAVDGWTAPAQESVTISQGVLTQLEREYSQQRYHLTVLASEELGEVIASPAPDEFGDYVQDTVVTLTAVPTAGYTVQGWNGADALGLGHLTNTVTMTSDRTVTVAFVIDPFDVYQLSVWVTGSGTVSPRQGTYHEGEIVVLVATPASGYQVKSWSGADDDSSAANVNSITMNGNHTVHVEFEPWSDCNEDGLSDRLDIADGYSADCNGNGLPDECEVDSDNDGVIDDCALSSTDDVVPPVLSQPACGVGAVQVTALMLVGFSLAKTTGGLRRTIRL